MQQLRKLNAALILALSFLVVNLMLRVWFIASQDVALDEPFSIFWAQKSLSEIWHLAANENNPPLHFIIEHFWIRAFGIEAFSIRFPSLLFSVIGTAVVVYTLAKKHTLFSAFIAGLLLTLSTEHVYYSHEARAYALLFLLTALAFYYTSDLVQNPLKKKTYFILAIITVLLIYTHYLSVWVILAEIVIWLIYCRSFAAFKSASVAVFIVFAGFIPLAYAAFQRLSVMQQTGTWVNPPEPSQLYGHINILLNGAIGTIAFLVACILALLASVILFKKRGLSQLYLRDILIPATWFLLIYLGMYIQSVLFQPVFIPRYLFFSSVPLFIVMAILMDKLAPTKALRIACTLILVMGMLPGFSLNPKNNRAMTELLTFVNSHTDSETALVIAPKSFELAYLYSGNRDLFTRPESYKTEMLRSHIYALDHFDELPDSIKHNATRIVFIDADVNFTLPENGILKGLQKRYHLATKRHFHQSMDVYVFEP